MQQQQEPIDEYSEKLKEKGITIEKKLKYEETHFVNTSRPVWNYSILKISIVMYGKLPYSPIIEW